MDAHISMYAYKYNTHGFGTQLLFWRGLTSQIMGQIKSSKTTMFQISWSVAPHDRHIKTTIRKMSTKTVWSHQTNIFIPLGCTRWAPHELYMGFSIIPVLTPVKNMYIWPFIGAPYRRLYIYIYISIHSWIRSPPCRLSMTWIQLVNPPSRYPSQK